MTTPNDALDCYPTPERLAFDMVFSLREVKSGFTTYPKPILEPSAGDGALARQVHALAFNVHHDYKTGEVDRYSKNVHYYNGWCTNSAYKINRKVIFRCNAFDTYDGRFCPRYNATGHVAQIERVLHFLDTNGKPYNGDELRAVLDAAEKSGQTQKIQLHYFTATLYK